ncbi:MAG TPA: SpoIIE family protein phosphatase [Terriglobales bacterium]|nr:SpoIIE family protein phosphatase [Terriglobales bacterium]
MATSLEPVLRDQLLNRRETLQRSVTASTPGAELVDLLQQVDQALERIDKGTYGLCQVCHESIEPERLAADPLTCFCLDHLTPADQRALERDLDLARQIQAGLLPKPDVLFADWQISYHYQPAGLVSGDYCDVVDSGGRGLYFMLGDVSGKGIAAAMLMSNLHALFRALISAGLPLAELVTQASRAFCETTLAAHYATLVCGLALPGGEVELCNAGHLPPLHTHDGKVAEVPSTGLPLGMFCAQEFAICRVHLQANDTLLLYTDGFTESEDGSGTAYGTERLSRLVAANRALAPKALLQACRKDLDTFRGATTIRDDLTLLAIRRSS